MWAPVQEADACHRVHILPIEDLVQHEMVGDDCACGPEVEYDEEGAILIIHQSLDRREDSEPDGDAEATPEELPER